MKTIFLFALLITAAHADQNDPLAGQINAKTITPGITLTTAESSANGSSATTGGVETKFNQVKTDSSSKKLFQESRFNFNVGIGESVAKDGRNSAALQVDANLKIDQNYRFGNPGKGTSFLPFVGVGGGVGVGMTGGTGDGSPATVAQPGYAAFRATPIGFILADKNTALIIAGHGGIMAQDSAGSAIAMYGGRINYVSGKEGTLYFDINKYQNMRRPENQKLEIAAGIQYFLTPNWWTGAELKMSDEQQVKSVPLVGDTTVSGVVTQATLSAGVVVK